ncbi:hypothetical protein JT358_08770 [Micrococcales bacterium 31B]|nr:hypothetical protein [Micrococcales bacterium 31B]
MTTTTFTVPQATARLLPDGVRPPFSANACAREPIDLAAAGYVEREYLVAGRARLFEETPGGVLPSAAHDYVTRIIVRTPAAPRPDRSAWVSVLNASQGYDIEDDWRRAHNLIIARGDTYVGVTSKPINAAALRTYDAQRYATLTWGGDLPDLRAVPGWNPFQVLKGGHEGLAWEILAQVAAWLRGGSDEPRPRDVYLIGQSQSGLYVNTFAHHFHDILRTPAGTRCFDGFLSGVAGVFVRELNQGEAGPCQQLLPRHVTLRDLDVPHLVVTSEADTTLFTSMFGFTAADYCDGDGPLRRHWHVAAAPHSDARSRVIPRNEHIEAAGRLPRVLTQNALDQLNTLPLEPIVTAAMVALVNWSRDGEPAAPSLYFGQVPGRPHEFARAATGLLTGGIRLGLAEHALVRWVPALPENAVCGGLELRPRDEVMREFPTFAHFEAAYRVVDDNLESRGYLEPLGRALLDAVAQELWSRVAEGAPALAVTPQPLSLHLV